MKHIASHYITSNSLPAYLTEDSVLSFHDNIIIIIITGSLIKIVFIIFISEPVYTSSDRGVL